MISFLLEVFGMMRDCGTMLNTGLGNMNWTYLGAINKPNVPLLTRSQVSEIKKYQNIGIPKP